MVEFKKKNRRSFWYSPLFLVVLFLLFSFFTYKVFLLWGKYKESINNKKIASGQLEALRERKDLLTKDVANMQTKEGIESIIRSKFQVVKKGEKEVIITDDNNYDNNTSANNSVQKSSVSSGFWNWIKNIFR